MFKRLFSLFLSVITLFTACLFGLNNRGFSAVKADSENTVRLSTKAAVSEGSINKATIYLRTYEEISSLSITVYINPDVFEITGHYNIISANIYDASVLSDSITYTYIFNSVDTQKEQQVFAFSYRTKVGSVPGSYYFDVLVNEAYNSSLDNVEVSTSRTDIVIQDNSATERVYANPLSSTTSTSIGNTFYIHYLLNKDYVCGGTFAIQYDPEYFEFKSLQKLGFFDDKLFDYNADYSGQILVSFAAVSTTENRDLFRITFETIKNVTDSSQIVFGGSVYDYDLNDLNFTSTTVNMRINYVAPDIVIPKMDSSFTIDSVNQTVDINIHLEVDSHLGAGDFILKFDKEIFTYVGYEKKFSPTFFTVNDKETQLNQGQVKFSILSTTDIVNATNVITFTFSYSEIPSPRYSYVDLSGSGITDSLTNPIELDVSGVYVLFAEIDIITEWANTYLFMNDPSFGGDGTGRCLSDNLYIIAKRALVKLDSSYIQNFQNDKDGQYTAALARYLAWAHACGDTSPFEGTDIVLANNSLINKITTESDMLIFVIIAVVSIMTISSLVFVQRKKSKHN